MARTVTFEQVILSEANDYILDVTNNMEERLCLLEASAALYSGADIYDYWKTFGIKGIELEKNARHLNYILDDKPIPFSMAISSLCRQRLSIEEQRKNGAFYTDYRLASFVANSCEDRINEKSKIADFAAGTGILLIGVAEKYKQKFNEKFDDWLQNYVYAYDLSDIALRGARAAFLSMTSNIKALNNMFKNWRCCDSLLENQMPKFDIIVGNPPWGKIKLSRHTYIRQKGEERIYGSEYSDIDKDAYSIQKAEIFNYSKKLKKKYELLGNTEPDMYMAFLELASKSLKDKGAVFLLVPAGLIRSKGTMNLREYLLEKGSFVKFNLFNNKARFFSIDSRFKFLLLEYVAKGDNDSTEANEFYYTNCRANETKVFCDEEIVFNRKELVGIRPDLTIPEINTQEELNLFFKIYRNGRSWGNTPDIWKASLLRELDMTNDAYKFQKVQTDTAIPVVEGRMVQNHRFGTKAYVEGSGRSAKWVPCLGGCKPQFYCNIETFSDELKCRVKVNRAGYCDIAGQTNERSMMSAIIPSNVVCGNKVPTILFPNDTSGNMIYLWVGITNSFVFDWMIRRIISTTVNYFLLLSLPMPNIDLTSDVAKEIIKKTKILSTMKESFYKDPKADEIKADIDVAVAKAYGLSLHDMEIIMKDFPLIDRAQPTIEGEKRSTITRDMILSLFCEKTDDTETKYADRVKQGKEYGARSYIPKEMIGLIKE